jgi:hypothetical protein
MRIGFSIKAAFHRKLSIKAAFHRKRGHLRRWLTGLVSYSRDLGNIKPLLRRATEKEFRRANVLYSHVCRNLEATALGNDASPDWSLATK